MLGLFVSRQPLHACPYKLDLSAPTEGSSVHGEIWEVDEATLATIGLHIAPTGGTRGVRRRWTESVRKMVRDA